MKPVFLAMMAAGLLLVGGVSVKAAAPNLSHAYHASSTIVSGSIVSLDPNHADTVQLANTSNGPHVVGVAVAGDSLIAIDPAAGEPQVATSGTANTLVSTLGGDIKIGDKVAVSPLNGIGMKAPAGGFVIGLAQAAWNARSQAASIKSVTDTSGKVHSVAVGYIPVSIAVGVNGVAASTAPVRGLQKIVQGLTGHVVSTTRIVLALAVAVIALVSLVTLIYGSIYGSIISVGRNPMARNSILFTLWFVLGLAVLTAVVAILIVFFLLR